MVGILSSEDGWMESWMGGLWIELLVGNLVTAS